MKHRKVFTLAMVVALAGCSTEVWNADEDDGSDVAEDVDVDLARDGVRPNVLKARHESAKNAVQNR